MNEEAILQRVRECLHRTGHFDVPDDSDANLSDFGVDSLISAMWILEMQREFNVLFDLDQFDPRHFATLDSAAATVRRRLNDGTRARK